MKEVMIGLAEAAMHLGVPYQDAHRLLLTGKIRGEKRGSRWFVQVVDVKKLMVGTRTKSASEGGRRRAIGSEAAK